MPSDRKWTIGIRPAKGEAVRKITKIIGLNGKGFSVLTPYHKAKSGFLYKHRINLLPLGVSLFKWEECVGFTAEDRAKLTYHIDGFAQFSSEAQGKIISGRDPKTGEPKGLGIYARSLTSPSISGPSVGVQVWGIEEFDKADDEQDLIVFEPEDVYYRNSNSQTANSWALCIYAFPIGVVPPLQFEGDQGVMWYQPHSITAGVPGAVIKIKAIRLLAEHMYLGLYVERFVIDVPVKSGWKLNGPGNYTQYQSGDVLSATYPRHEIPVEGAGSLDRTPTEPTSKDKKQRKPRSK
jgi:hypothetical protein